jgi:hypothetical protein
MDARKKEILNPKSARVGWRIIALFGSFCSIGFPFLISFLLLSNQMNGYRFALIVVALFAVFAFLLVAVQSLVYRGTVQGMTLAFLRITFVRFRWLICVLITAGVFLISNHLLARGLAVGIWDAEGSFFPFHVLLADHARCGRFLQWDPWSNAGQPLSSSPETGAFSPVNLALSFFTGGTSSGFIASWLVMWCLGGFGIIMLARHLDAPPWGGCAVALGFLFCGAYTGNAQHTSWIEAYSFLPLIIWRLDVSLRSQKIWPSVEAGALWGLSALAGYPGITIITGSFCALWGVGRWLSREPSNEYHPSNNSDSGIRESHPPTLQYVLSALALLLLVGLVVLSPTYFAFLFEGAGTHMRAGNLSREIAVYDNALDPGALSTFASPYLATLKANDQLQGLNSLWPYTDLSMCSVYSGPTVFVLALLAILRHPRDRWRWWLVALGAFSLACALGRALPLRGWLFDLFYPMRFFRHAAIFRYYYLFAISVLALFGTRDIAVAIQQKADRTWKYFLATSVFASFCSLLVFLKIAASVESAERGSYLSTGQGLGTWLVVSGIWLGICGVAYIGRILPDQPKAGVIPALFLVVAGSDAFLTASISQVTMISTDPVAVRRWQQLDENHSTALDLTSNGLLRKESSCSSIDGNENKSGTEPFCKLNDQYITKTPVFDSYTTMKNTFHLRMTQNAILRRMASGTERIWFSKEVCQVAPTEEYFSAFVTRTDALAAAPLLIHTPETLLSLSTIDEANEITANQMSKIKALPACEQIAVDLVRYLPDELVFEVHCPADGWLLVTDRWARSWQAEVNGKRAVVYGGNFIFRAIQVSAGPNRVRFAYSPPGFAWLVILSWGTLALVAVGVARGRASARSKEMTMARA